MLALLAASALLATFILAAAAEVRQRRLRKLLPPGPAPHWLRGNPVPALYSWRNLGDVAHRYGGVAAVWQGRTPLVVVGSVEAAEDLLEKHAAQTADRPRQVVADEVLSRGHRVLLVGETPRLKRMRKSLHAYLQPSAAKRHEPVQEHLAARLVCDIAESPASFMDHVIVYATSLTIRLAYGLTGRFDITHPFVVNVERNKNYLSWCLRPGAFLANDFPCLKHVPGMVSRAKVWSENEHRLFRANLQDVADNPEGRVDCLSSFLLEHREFGLEYDEIAYNVRRRTLPVRPDERADGNHASGAPRDLVSPSLSGQAGSHTSLSAIQFGLMAAAVFPDAQQLVQAELDRVVGRNRMPTFADMDKLPITLAYSREVQRWRPVSSGGFQHATTADLTWKGSVIPKGTAIIGNHWAISRDPTAWPDPDRFDPTRFLKKAPDGAWLIDDKVKHCGYGFGRRICSGLHVANRSVFITLASILHAYTLHEFADRPIDTLLVINAVNSGPTHDLAIDFRPRFPGAMSLARDAVASSEGV